MSLNILIPRCVGHRTVLSTNNCGGPGCRWCRCLCDIHGHRNGSGPWEGNLGSERKGAVLFHGGYCGCLCSCCWEIENRSECFRCVSFRRFIAETETAISGSFTDARLPNANETEQQMDQWIALTDPPWFSGLLRSFHLTVCLACWKAAAPAFLEANTVHKRHKLLFDFHTAYSSLSESNISWQRIYILTGTCTGGYSVMRSHARPRLWQKNWRSPFQRPRPQSSRYAVAKIFKGTFAQRAFLLVSC